MNLNNFVIANYWIVLLMVTIPITTQNLLFIDSVQAQQQTQETTISINLEDLRQPHFLKIRGATKGTQLNGQIKLDGEWLQSIKNNHTQINLSPKLTKGRHIISIAGEYSPTNSSVLIEFSGTNTQVSQQTGGSGYINQTLIIEVIK